MNSASENSGNERDRLTIYQAAGLLWEWRKYRNQIFWNSMYRWGAASLVLTITPYLLPDLIEELGLAVFVFPAIASLLSFFAAYLLAVQYLLYKQVNNKYRSVLNEYNPEDIPDNTLVNRVLRTSIGKILVALFLCFAVIVEFFNGLVLLWLVHRTLP